MAKLRPILVVSLVVLWTVAPALACLPNHQMTQAEMDCCKKMAGDCHRGASEHPCCKTTAKVDAPIATLQQVLQFNPDAAILCLTPSLQSQGEAEGLVAQVHLGLPPPAPPGPYSILRI
jgi:hypothetical protein